MPTRYLCAVAWASAGIIYAEPARADADFGYVYTADVEERGETEVTLWATDRRGKGEGHYDAQDYRLEVEHGITDRFQASAYLNLQSHHIRGVDAELERVDRDFALSGLAAEFKYQLLNPEKNGVGLAFYAEPAWSRISKVKGEKSREFELELKAILQKNFAHDRLVWATNLTLEPEWEREHEEVAPGIVNRTTEKELAIELSTGLAYRIADKWWMGVEGRYHSVYPNWTHGLNRENYAIYAGPTVHYDGGKFSVTATYQPQLFGAPNEGSSSLEVDDHEKREFRVKLSYEF